MWLVVSRAAVRDEGSAGGYGRFGVLSRVEMERFFHLDDEDWRLIAGRRRDHNRLCEVADLHCRVFAAHVRLSDLPRNPG